MTAGRRPTPTALKVLRGNPGKRAMNRAEPRPAPKVPPCPKHLDEEAKREWRRVSKELHGLGLLTTIDRAALAAYCAAWSQWVESTQKVQSTGLLVKTPSGYPIQNPYLAIGTSALKQMRAFLTEFGMTPAARSRVHGSGEEPVDEFTSFMQSKPGVARG